MTDVLLDRLRLELEPLLRVNDVGDAALDVLKLLEHLLVRVVERLVRVLGPVERLEAFALKISVKRCHKPAILLLVGVPVSLAAC